MSGKDFMRRVVLVAGLGAMTTLAPGAIPRARAGEVPADTKGSSARNLAIYGEARHPVIRHLTAGPIRLKYQDGELRYLYVGDREIIRRVYFAVRNPNGDTVMPKFTRDEIHIDGKGGFTIHVEATCKNDNADYRWSGDIAGTAGGVITYRVSGHANRDFHAPRIGLNILFGTDALAGQSYEGIGKDGAVKATIFPKEVDPKLLTNTNFTTVRYTTADGMQVSCALTGNGFGIEDQRLYGDSSFKGYHALDYRYTDAIPSGVERSDTLTLAVTQASIQPATTGSVNITLGTLQPSVMIPKLLPAAQSQPSGGIYEAMDTLGKKPYLAKISWRFIPSTHLPDEDTLLENLSAIADQVRSARKVAPEIMVRLDPVNFNSPFPRPGPDPRNGTLFGTTWAAAAVGAMAYAGVDEAVFTMGPGPAAGVLQRLAAYAGCHLVSVTTAGTPPAPVQAFAIDAGKTLSLWLVNKTNQPQAVVLHQLPPGAMAREIRLTAATAGKPLGTPQRIAKDGTRALTLAPYEVYEMTIP